LFDNEGQTLQELKKHDIAVGFEDRFLMGCLFSRKLDIKRTIVMLESNKKWRKENGYEQLPHWSSLNKNLLLSDFAFTIPGTRTKDGYGIYYAKFGNMVPEDHGKNFVKDIIDYIIWNNMIGSFYEDMDFHRNGLCFIADMKSVGWKNLDMKLQKTVNSALMDNFPMKISQVIVINPPSIFKPLLAGSRLFVKKKILDRINTMEESELSDFISQDQLSSDLGGNFRFTIETYIDWVDNVIATEGTPKTPVQVPLKQKSKKVYPRDDVPHLGLEENISDKKPVGEEEAGNRKSVWLPIIVNQEIPNKSRRYSS